MSTAVTALATKLAKRFDMEGEDVLATLKSTAFKGQVSDAQMAALLIVAGQYGLNPWTREIYAFPDKNNGIVPVVGVDGWARIINEHAQFDGMEFSMPEDGSECTCTVYRKDRTHPIRVTEYLDECRRGTGPWQSHPKRMLRHKAMIQAARLAFGYVGIFDQDEAERIVEKDITADVQVVNGRQAPKAMLDDVTFQTIAVKYRAKIADGSKAPNDFIAWVESKGALMTEAQKLEVASWINSQPQTIEGEVVDDPFVADMERAEQEGAAA